MLDLKTALRQGVEAHRRLTMPPRKETEPAAAGGDRAEATLFSPPKAVAPAVDDLTPPASVTAKADNLELPRQPEITFEPEPPAPAQNLTPAANPAEQLEQALRQSLRRYASIRRQEELL